MVVNYIKEVLGYGSKLRESSIIDITKEKILNLINEACSEGISNLKILTKVDEDDFDTAEALFYLELENKIKVLRRGICVREDGGFVGQKFYVLA